MNKKINIFNRISTKIIIAVAIIMVVSITIVTSTAKSFATNRLQSSEIDGLENVAEEKAIALEQYISDQKIIAQLVKTNSTVIEQAMIYKMTGEINPTVQAAICNSLTVIYENAGQIYENLFVTFGTEGYADCLGNATLHDVGEENFYIQCVENGYYFGNNVSPVTGRPVYVIAYAITSPTTGEMIGSVNMSIDMAALGRDIVNTGAYDVTVLDYNGYVIATSGLEDSILTDIKSQDPEGFDYLVNSKQGYVVKDLTMYGLGVTYLGYMCTDNFIVETSLDETVITAPVKEMTRNLSLVSSVLFIMCITLTLILIIWILKPVKRATKAVSNLASEIESGSGDLTNSLEVKTKDEIGILVDGVNNLVQTMGKLIASVQNTTSKVSDSSAEINSKIDVAKTEITSVSATMEEMSASSEETSASLSQVMIQVDNVAEQVDGVNSESISEAKYAEEVVEKVKGIREKSAAEREEANAHLEEVARNLREKIENAKQVQEIANLTVEILNITSQTNLLSLNASIEAARAGEAGKGFAVVADEIRQLADSSKEAANRIQEVTDGVIVAVEALASEAENVTDFMLENNESNHKSTDELTESYSGDITRLAEAMASFKVSSDQIKESMNVIKEAIDAVNIAAEETAKGITNVAESTVELTNELQDVAGMTDENLNESTSLSDVINKYIV